MGPSKQKVMRGREGDGVERRCGKTPLDHGKPVTLVAPTPRNTPGGIRREWRANVDEVSWT